MSLPPYSFKHLMSIISSSKIATLFKFVSTVLFHRSSAILDFMEVTADYSFPDFRSPFPAPRSPFAVLVTSGITVCEQLRENEPRLIHTRTLILTIVRDCAHMVGGSS